MLMRAALCAVAFAAVAPQALAQSTLVTNQYIRQGSPESPPVDIGRGRLDFQTPAQQACVERLMPGIEKAIALQLSNPSSAQLSSLRTGLYQKAMVVCGVVDSVAASGESEKRRFIARPSIATLETRENAQAFRAGWKSTGCGF